MSKIKMAQSMNVEGVERAVDEVVEVVDESLAEVLIRDGVAAAITEEHASVDVGTDTSAPSAEAESPTGTSEGEATSA